MVMRACRTAHSSGMQTHPSSFHELAQREPADLTADERESLEYYYASVNLAEGLPAEGNIRRWCQALHDVARVAHLLGRIPKPGDPGATPEIIEWIDVQRRTRLTSYQRAKFRALPGRHPFQ